MNAESRIGSPWFFLLAIAVAIAIFQGNPAFAISKPAEIRSIQILEGSETDFLISANQNFQFHMFTLKNPERLVVDCWPAVLSPEFESVQTSGSPTVIGVRPALFQKDVVRVVFDLKEPAKYSALTTGAALRVRIATRPQTNVQPKQSQLSIPPGQDPVFSKSISNDSIPPRDLDVSISTNQTKMPGADLTAKSPKRRSPVKMQGYVGDNFAKDVVSGKRGAATAGSFYGMNLRYKKQNKSKKASLNVTYNIFGYEYAEPFVEDYKYQDFSVGYELKLSPKWSVKTVGRVELAEYGDQYGFRPELAYHFTPRSQFSFFGGHRTKLIPDYHERTDQERFFGVGYKSKIIRNQTLELSYQHSFNNSERNRYDYTYSRYTIGYTVPWGPQSRTVFKFDYTPRQYESRLVKVDALLDPEFHMLRQEQGYAFSVLSHFRLTRHLEFEPRYIYMIRNSNEPFLDDYTLHVASFALRGSW